jgi:hypothetical protein
MPISNYLALHKASLLFYLVVLIFISPSSDANPLNNRGPRSGSFGGIMYRSGDDLAQTDQRQDRPAVQSSFDRIHRWQAR